MTVFIRNCKGCCRKLKTVHLGAGPPRIRCARCTAERHRQRQLARMRNIRARDAAYREREKRAVRKRMRKLRAALHAQGLSNMGTPYQRPKVAAALIERYSR